MQNLYIKIPDGANVVIDKLYENGHSAFVVGGCVRDFILEKEPHDWDICTDALPEQVMQIFGEKNVIPTGIKHGTVTVLIGNDNYEVTTYRIDGMSRLSFLINREDKRLSNSVVDILNMLEMGESVDMIASDMNSKTTNIRRIIRENDIGQDTISTTLQWRKAIKKLLPDREANVIRWNESKESAIPYKLCVPKHFLNAAGSAPVTVIPVIAMLRNTPPDYFGQNLEVIPWRTIVQHLLSEDNKQCVRFVLRKWEAANPEEAALGNPLGYKDVSRRRYAEKLDSIGMTHCLYGDLENILPKEFSVARI